MITGVLEIQGRLHPAGLLGTCMQLSSAMQVVQKQSLTTCAPAPAFKHCGRPHLPGVIDEDGVTGSEERLVVVCQAVLPLKLALDGDCIVPHDDAVRAVLTHGCRQVPALAGFEQLGL